MKDEINHPAHYNSGKIEVIEFIEDQGFGPGFHLGNAIKYAARAGKKDPSKMAEDLEKAGWYLNRWVEIENAKKENRAPARPNQMNEVKSPETHPVGKTSILKPPFPASAAPGTSSPIQPPPFASSVPCDDLVDYSRYYDFCYRGEWIEIHTTDKETHIVFLPHGEELNHLESLMGKDSVIKGQFLEMNSKKTSP